MSLCFISPERGNGKMTSELVQVCKQLKHLKMEYKLWQGGIYLFQIWEYACAMGVRGHAPQEIFLKWCNLVRFDVYLDQILSLKIFKNYYFLFKK